MCRMDEVEGKGKGASCRIQEGQRVAKPFYWEIGRQSMRGLQSPLIPTILAPLQPLYPSVGPILHVSDRSSK